MSLIIEALKKAEKARQDPSGQKPPTGKDPQHPTNPNPFGSGQFRIVLIAIFLLLGAFLFGMILSKARKPAEPILETTPGIVRPVQVPVKDIVTPIPRVTPMPLISSSSLPSAQIQAEPEPRIFQKPATSEPVQPALEESDHWLNEITQRAIETSKNENQLKDTPQATPVPSPSMHMDLRLQLVVGSDANPSAMINGKIVYVGDEIQGWIVKGITRNEVSMERDGRRHVLRF